jgi:hypothetical protein
VSARLRRLLRHSALAVMAVSIVLMTGIVGHFAAEWVFVENVKHAIRFGGLDLYFALLDHREDISNVFALTVMTLVAVAIARLASIGTQHSPRQICT